MAIILRLDRIMADRKMSLNELAEKVGITNVTCPTRSEEHTSELQSR